LALILIYPNDSSTIFLNPILECVNSLNGIDNIKLVKTSNDPNGINIIETRQIISETSDDDIIVFIGHGNSSCLYGPPISVLKQVTLIDSINSKSILLNKQIISLSCWSADFLNEINVLKTGIGFGNIPTTWGEFNKARSQNKLYKHYTPEGSAIYTSAFVDAFSNGLKDGLKNSFSVKSVYLYIKLHLNRSIDKCARGDSDHIYAGKLLSKFKKEMMLVGNIK
jgi:hypothetical protein